MKVEGTDFAVVFVTDYARAADFYERGLRRFDGTWPGMGLTGERFLDPEHPYAADLDLFGRWSLFERLCAARTRAGEETLAAWLLAPADPDSIRARQEAVDELRPRLDLREDLELLGADVGEGVDPESLASTGLSLDDFQPKKVHVELRAPPSPTPTPVPSPSPSPPPPPPTPGP